MTELSVVAGTHGRRSPEPLATLQTKSAHRATRPLKWKMCDGSSLGPAWLWLPFLSSHGIGYGSSLPPPRAGSSSPRDFGSHPPRAPPADTARAPPGGPPAPLHPDPPPPT